MMVSALIEREIAGPDFPVRGGVFVAVVGPSGAGKDTIIDFARAALGVDGDVDFVRRVVTRPSDASTEDHDSLTDADFDVAEAAGAFALSWAAHGLKYGLPSSVDQTIAHGRVAVANLSRGALPALRLRYTDIAVIEITADREVLAERLSARGRESRGDVLARLARAAEIDRAADVITLDNSGAPEIAGEKFVAILRKAIAHADLGGMV
ncbi:phosphonate metabolism protein/1,5-bisphosphokinase (PRPP-forming) PhnN [Mesorhizobium sp. NBSH29]|uniref:phosphonate metabolism protein/1,5-bisphosphokinase (PRPP-forming) PhnN n=1 Tax=Mesorhizobium sp. NBSH29 TaxID=2654249 RepID=UPI00189651C0|nr:phosphonate metabolism protein/1,5-bisphosphokinase (PRPP-forming) PhnN [Mesorhizobium sp. NBSH29]QPC86153.1 phosphonate metabolism protein/1,5-bisphosphokinase (PRPP-forming) PhnN [Mesorhizobium sp. NBSH29]